MNLPITKERGSLLDGKARHQAITLNRNLMAHDLDLGKDYYNVLKQMLQRALVAAKNAERKVATQQVEIDRLQKLSVTDATTGLLNRRGFAESLERTLERGRRYNEPAVLMLIDLDGFKRINDEFGHAAGDFVLTVVADRLKSAVRAVDDVARIGGDEFAIVLTKLPHQRADKHVQAIEDTLNSLVIPWGDDQIQVRASVGSQCFGQDLDDSAEIIYARADNAMYLKKGRKHALAAE